MSLAMQEDFSLQQAYIQARAVPLMHRTCTRTMDRADGSVDRDGDLPSTADRTHLPLIGVAGLGTWCSSTWHLVQCPKPSAAALVHPADAIKATRVASTSVVVEAMALVRALTTIVSVVWTYEKYQDPVDAEPSTELFASNAIVGRSTCKAPEAHGCFVTMSQLITLEWTSHGNDVALRTLLDSGASSNFIRQKTLAPSFLKVEQQGAHPSFIKIRLATGKVVSAKRRGMR